MDRDDTITKDMQLEIETLRDELNNEFFMKEEPDFEKATQIRRQLDKLASSSVDSERIKQNRKAFLDYANRQIDAESSQRLLRHASSLQRTRPSYKIKRVLIIVPLVLIFMSIAAYALGIDLFSLVIDFGDNQNKLTLTKNESVNPNAFDNMENNSPNGGQLYFDNMEDALAAMPMRPAIPSYTPKGSTLYQISVLRPSDLHANLQVIYVDESGAMSCMMTLSFYEDTDNLSFTAEIGDDYLVVERYENSTEQVTVFKDSADQFLAYWDSGHFVYRVYTGIGVDELKKIVNSFK